MNCAESRERIAERIVDGAPPTSHCPACSGYAEELRSLAQKISELPPVLERFAQVQPAVKPPARTGRRMAAVAAAAVFALAIFLALDRTSPTPGDSKGRDRLTRDPSEFEQYPQRIAEPDRPLRGKILWEVDLGRKKENGVFTSPVVEGDRLYV